MAKDGSNRGGRRQRSGPPKEGLADKVLKGRAAEVMDFNITPLYPADIPAGGDDIPMEDIPKPSEYLSAKQRDGKPLGADKIYLETMRWLKQRNCAHLINPRQVESYAEAFARYIQCSEAVSKYGNIGKHPTTQQAMASPFVSMELQYQKQAFVLWTDIFQIVKENSLTPFSGMPNRGTMDDILNEGREAW